MMREGRWRELDATAAADGRWPGADRRRATVDEAARGGQQLAAGAKRPDRRRGEQQCDTVEQECWLSAGCEWLARCQQREGIEPEQVSTASTAATAYRYGDLDADDRARFDALVESFGLSPEFVHPTFHVGQTRRGYVVLLTEYDHDDDGQPVIVLGQPVVRHHLQPVVLDELPVACRSERAR